MLSLDPGGWGYSLIWPKQVTAAEQVILLFRVLSLSNGVYNFIIYHLELGVFLKVKDKAVYISPQKTRVS